MLLASIIIIFGRKDTLVWSYHHTCLETSLESGPLLVAVGGVQLGRYSYLCTNQTEPSSAVSGPLCSHRSLCHSNITILSPVLVSEWLQVKTGRSIPGKSSWSATVLYVEHHSRHLLHDQSHAAGHTLAEHEEQIFYMPSFIFIQGRTPAAYMAEGLIGPCPGAHFMCGHRLAPKSSHQDVPWAQ